MSETSRTVLLTGATGFVGQHLFEPLLEAGFQVRAGSRRARSDEDRAGVSWVVLDVEQPETLASALEGCYAAIYLVHGMGQGGDFEDRERAAAEAFAKAANAAGVKRIVYVGGVQPKGEQSKHLRSRLQTGAILREHSGSTLAIELRCGMIIGPGSASFTIVRDLAMRLPAMILPRWLHHASQPVAVRDVAAAIVASLDAELHESCSLDLPGPETLTSKDVLLRVAALRGARPLTIDVPVISPRLSSHWIRLVSRANYQLAASLVEGLTADLVADKNDFERLLPGYQRRSFDEAASEAVEADRQDFTMLARCCEELVRWVTPRLPGRERQDVSPWRIALAFVLGALAFAIGHPMTALYGPWLPLGVAGAVVVLLVLLFDSQQLTPPPLKQLVRRALGGVAFGVLMTLATYLVYSLIAPSQPALRQSVQELYGWIGGPGGVRAWLPVLILVVTAEELVFRGLGYRLLRDRQGDLMALFLPTLIYALVHMGARSPILILLAAVCGLVWALQRLMTGSLLGVIMTHLTWDICILAIWPLEKAA